MYKLTVLTMIRKLENSYPMPMHSRLNSHTARQNSIRLNLGICGLTKSTSKTAQLMITERVRGERTSIIRRAGLPVQTTPLLRMHSFKSSRHLILRLKRAVKIVMNSRVRSLYSYSKNDLNKVSHMRDLVFLYNK